MSEHERGRCAQQRWAAPRCTITPGVRPQMKLFLLQYEHAQRASAGADRLRTTRAARTRGCRAGYVGRVAGARGDRSDLSVVDDPPPSSCDHDPGGRADGPSAELALPFVGRDTELARLREVLADAIASGEARLATVIGSPGVGKTRLARELGRAVADDARFVELRCERAGTATSPDPRTAQVGRVRRRRRTRRDQSVTPASRGRRRGLRSPGGAARIVRRHGGTALDRGCVLRGPAARGTPWPAPTAGAGDRRHPVGRAAVPRSARTPRPVGEGCAVGRARPRPPRAARSATRTRGGRPAGLGRDLTRRPRRRRHRAAGGATARRGVASGRV